MTHFLRLSSLLLLFSLTACITPQNPLDSISVPEPENPDLAYYFFRGARVVLKNRTDDFPQARQDLEQVIAADRQLLIPEAYPFLTACYQQLGLLDSADWIYETAQQRLEQPLIAKLYGDDFKRWQASYPEFPEEFTSREYRLLDKEPEPVGGYQTLYARLEYPEMARNMNRSGMSFLSFVIEADGTLSNLQLLKSSYPDLDEAALAVVQQVAWQPAVYHNRPVSFQLVIPIVFRL